MIKGNHRGRVVVQHVMSRENICTPPTRHTVDPHGDDNLLIFSLRDVDLLQHHNIYRRVGRIKMLLLVLIDLIDLKLI